MSQLGVKEERKASQWQNKNPPNNPQHHLLLLSHAQSNTNTPDAEESAAVAPALLLLNGFPCFLAAPAATSLVELDAKVSRPPTLLRRVSVRFLRERRHKARKDGTESASRIGQSRRPNRSRAGKGRGEMNGSCILVQDGIVGGR